MKTGNRGDERRKRVWSRVPRWKEVWMAENRQEMAWAAQEPTMGPEAAQVVLSTSVTVSHFHFVDIKGVKQTFCINITILKCKLSMFL